MTICKVCYLPIPLPSDVSFSDASVGASVVTTLVTTVVVTSLVIFVTVVSF